MLAHGELRIEPSAEVLTAARDWLEAPRAALGTDFLAAYLTGSVLTQGFDPRHSRVNLLVVARTLATPQLDAVAAALPPASKGLQFEPLFLTRRQIEKSLDVFPIEWLEIQERHLRLDGEDIFTQLEVPRTYLRLQVEHELRGKHIQLRQAYLSGSKRPAELGRVLKNGASSFATLFRTLLRLRGESPPADAGRVIERVAELYRLDTQRLLAAHLFRFSSRSYKPAEMLAHYRDFLSEVDRLVTAIDEMSL
jgi:hypothetical protein